MCTTLCARQSWLSASRGMEGGSLPTPTAGALRGERLAAPVLAVQRLHHALDALGRDLDEAVRPAPRQRAARRPGQRRTTPRARAPRPSLLAERQEDLRAGRTLRALMAHGTSAGAALPAAVPRRRRRPSLALRLAPASPRPRRERRPPSRARPTRIRGHLHRDLRGAAPAGEVASARSAASGPDGLREPGRSRSPRCARSRSRPRPSHALTLVAPHVLLALVLRLLAVLRPLHAVMSEEVLERERDRARRPGGSGAPAKARMNTSKMDALIASLSSTTCRSVQRRRASSGVGASCPRTDPRTSSATVSV